MGFHMRDLPVYIMRVAVIGFFVYLAIQSRMSDKDKEKEEKKPAKK